jgi:hypothetical protein
MNRGRDVIAITSVGGRIWGQSVTLPGSSHARLRTAAMAMAALPKPEPHHLIRFPVSLGLFPTANRYPLTAKTRYSCFLIKTSSTQE